MLSLFGNKKGENSEGYQQKCVFCVSIGQKNGGNENEVSGNEIAPEGDGGMRMKKKTGAEEKWAGMTFTTCRLKGTDASWNHDEEPPVEVCKVVLFS